eukprot:Phypoly_transcript_00966.p1 GENE.Phypoly_transcript_00966~~Phypoly_transcript_00966.p1  ORF type:complete len:1258 (+),score=169.69 Phypoly_transcript_00966:20-3793(+)
MQPAPGSASPGNSNSSQSVSDDSEDDSQVEEDNIRNLHFSTVPIVTTERCIGPSELIGHSITLFDSTFFVIGGKLPHEEKYFNDVYMLDMHGESFIWSKPKVRGESLPPISAHAAIPFAKKIFVFGGRNAEKTSSDVFSFSTSTLSWTRCRAYGDRPAPRYGHSANTLNKRAFIVFGGMGEQAFNDIHVFDMTELSWERKSTKNTPSPRYAHGSVYHSGQLFVYGGKSSFNSTSNGSVLNDLHVLNTRDWSWKQITIDNSFPLYYHTMSFLSNHLVIVGGAKQGSGYSDSVYAIDMATNTWILIESIKRDRQKFPPLCGHATAVLKNRFLILLGGATDANTKEFGIRLISPIKISMSSKAKAVIAAKEGAINAALVEQIRKNLRDMRVLMRQKLESLGALHDPEFEGQLDAYEKRIENIASLPKLRLNGTHAHHHRTNSDNNPKTPTQNGNGSSTPNALSQNAGADNKPNTQTQEHIKRGLSDRALLHNTEIAPHVHRRQRSASMNVSAMVSNRVSLVPLPPRDANAADESIIRNHQRAMKEIVEGEIQFLADLQITRRVFMVPLQAMLSANDIQIIFTNLQQVIGVCQELVTKLEAVIRKPPENQNIGEVFIDMMPYLKVFLEFCSNHGEARAAVEHLKIKNPQFSKFLDDCLRNPECRLMEFESFLIKPMQRITRYPLLFRELLKYTSPTHIDYFNLVEAQQELQNLVQEANERKRSLENAARVAQIQRKMVWHGPKIMLLAQNRELLHENVFSATVTKSFVGPVKVDLNRKLRILVFTDTLIVVKNKKSLGSEKYVEKCRMPLHLCLIWPVSPEDIELKNSADYGEDAIIHGFSIVLPDTIRIVVFAGTQAEKDECMRMLGESVGKCGSFLMRQTHREKEKFRRSRSTNDLTRLTSLMKPALVSKQVTALSPRTPLPPSAPPSTTKISSVSPTPAADPPTPAPEKATPRKLTAEKPSAEKPGAEKPGAEKPTAEKPAPEKATAERPTSEKINGEKANADKAPTENESSPRLSPITRTISHNNKGVPNRNARVFFQNSVPSLVIPSSEGHHPLSISQPSPIPIHPPVLSPTFPTLSASPNRHSPTLQLPPSRLGNMRVSPRATESPKVDSPFTESSPKFPEFPELLDSPRASDSPRLSASAHTGLERRPPIDIVRRFSDGSHPKPQDPHTDPLSSIGTPRQSESPRNSSDDSHFTARESPRNSSDGSSFVSPRNSPDLASPRNASDLTSPRNSEKKSALRRATSMFNKKKKKDVL